MRTYPESEYDQRELKELNAAEWMVETLRTNPDYVFWGPHEDYMTETKSQWGLKELNAAEWMVETLRTNPDYVFWGPHEDYMTETKSQWGSRVSISSWSDFDWTLDELNECVNFYFEIRRENKECKACDQSGYNPETRKISDDWYDFAESGREWSHRITQVEADALVKAGRFPKGSTAEDINRDAHKGLGHDAINQGICVNARAKRKGGYGLCPKCKGKG
jgi:hypothetical protein